ncbi:MAG: class I SAM-dependent methyltransferase [Eubacteriales bacterium]|nr:class I SAM-dependent methyltransferase [Eubacteriales bacterium]
MKVSKRIKAIVSLIEENGLLADIGCDHGYTCIEAVLGGKINRALACDVNVGPLQRAAENISALGLNDKIETVLSNGLVELSENPDVITITGMGGLLIRDILSKRPEMVMRTSQLVLGPHSEFEELRGYLNENGLRVISETVLKDQGKFYVLFDVRPRCAECGAEGVEDGAKCGVKRGAECGTEGRPEYGVELAAQGGIASVPVYEDSLSLKYGNKALQRDMDAYMDYLKHLYTKTEKALSNALKGKRNEKTIQLERELEELKELTNGSLYI